MEYMEQQMQTFIEAGVSEADRCYVRIAELEEQNAALAAVAGALGDKLSEVVVLLDVDGMTAVQWLLDNCQEIESLINMESEQHLVELRAEVGRAGFIAGADALEVAQILGSDFDTESAAIQYADKIRQENK